MSKQITLRLKVSDEIANEFLQMLQQIVIQDLEEYRLEMDKANNE